MLARRIATVVLVGALLATRHARADSPCDVRLEAASARTEWKEALVDVRAFVEHLTPDTTDCRSIVVSPDGDGATVVFTTADGRSARRRVGEPRELRALVEALLVNGRDPAPLPPPPPDEVASPAPPAPAPREASPRVVAAATDEDVRAAPAKNATAPLLGAGAGVKGSFPRDAIAGVGQVFAGASFGAWELAAFGRWELEHDAPSDANARRLRYSAIGGGGMFGRREQVGPVILVAGARASVLAAEEERGSHHDGAPEGKLQSDFLDPRLGMYVGCVLSESSRVRFRVQVDADAGLVEHRAEVAELPNFPRWNLGVSLGAETGIFR